MACGQGLRGISRGATVPWKVNWKGIHLRVYGEVIAHAGWRLSSVAAPGSPRLLLLIHTLYLITMNSLVSQGGTVLGFVFVLGTLWGGGKCLFFPGVEFSRQQVLASIWEERLSCPQVEGNVNRRNLELQLSAPVCGSETWHQEGNLSRWQICAHFDPATG